MSTQIAEKITIEGFSIVQKKGVDYSQALRGWRIYGTNEVFIMDDGKRVAKPNTWRLMHDLKFKRHARSIIWPDFELEPTTDEGDGIKLYAGVGVDAEGREQWHNASYMVLPPEWGPEMNAAEWMLENLHLDGVIDLDVTGY